MRRKNLRVVVKQITIPQSNVETKKWIERNPALISLFSCIITLIALIFTICYSMDTLKLSTDQFNESKIQRKSDSIKFKEASDKQDTIDQKQLKFNQSRDLIAINSLKEQINSIRLIKSQFELGNEPYLQIRFPTLETFQVGKPITIIYEIVNLGSYPIKINFSQTYISTKVSMPKTNMENVEEFGPDKLSGAYVIKETPDLNSESDSRILDVNRFNEVTKGNMSVWFVGRINYTNLITKKSKNYRFAIKFKNQGFVGLLKFNSNTLY